MTTPTSRTSTSRPSTSPHPAPSVESTDPSPRRLALKRGSAIVDHLRPKPQGVVCLAYHRVGRTTSVSVDLPSDLFDAQMSEVAARNPGTLSSLADWLDGIDTQQPGPVVTFDDGTADFITHALPILVKHRVPAALYLATDFADTGRSFPDDGTPLSWDAVREAHSTGLVTIESHTHTHLLCDRSPIAAVCADIDRSVQRIEDEVGVTPVHFAYPKALAGPAPLTAELRTRFRTLAVARTRPNKRSRRYDQTILRSPIQIDDGMTYFRAKLHGGMRAEDDLRRLINSVRHRRATH